MKKIAFLLLLYLLQNAGFSQQPQTLTLDSCWKMALEYYPVSRQTGLLTEIHNFKQESTQRGFYPQLNLNGQATWQSEVTSLPVNIPNIEIPSLTRDNYRISLDINQLIWDGGSIKSQQAMDFATLEINLTEVEIEKLKLTEAVNQTYFSILILKESEKLISLAMDEIHSRLYKVRAGIANGAVLPANADVLDAELIRLEQTLIDIRFNRNAAIYRLNELTGLYSDATTALTLPEYHDLPALDQWQRPEYQLFDLQKIQFDNQQQMIGLKLMPRFSAFSNLGYGRPGLDMFSASFEPFAMLGLRLSWNIWEWNITGRNKSITGIQKQITDTQKQAWEINQRILLNNHKQEILKIENQLAADHRIVALRKSIASSAAVQLELGVITSSEYLTEQNAFTQANLNLGVNKIMLQRARLNYLTTMGFTTYKSGE
jgi:outer membrane protein TolC